METNKKIPPMLLGLVLGILITSAIFLVADTKKDSMDMSHTMEGMMSGLEGKTGDAFDTAFLSEMIVHHQGAVDMAEAVLETSKRPELLQLANNIIAAQTKEIAMMQGWQKSWFGVDASGVSAMDIDTYVKTHISELSPVKETLGGTFFVTKITTGDGMGSVEYEDGHNAYVADFMYMVHGEGTIMVTSFTIRK